MLRPARAARRGVIGAPVARTAAVVGQQPSSRTVSTGAMTAERTDATTEETDATTGATAAKRRSESRRTSNEAVASTRGSRSSGTVAMISWRPILREMAIDPQ